MSEGRRTRKRAKRMDGRACSSGGMSAFNKGQSHEELGPLVVQQVVHLNELVLQGLVGVLNRQNQEVWDAVDGPLAECLDDVEVLGEGHRNPLGRKLGLSLDKPAADPARPKGPAALKRGCDYQH